MIKKPEGAKKRRERSELTREDCLLVFEHFAKNVRRFVETSDPGAFVTPSSVHEPMQRCEINIQFCVKGSFGTGGDMFEAIRVLAGWKLPRKL